MVGTVRIDVVTLLFLLVPGLVGMKLFLRAYVKLDDLSRIDKLAVSVLLGGFALAIPLFLLNWTCWTDQITAFLVRPHAPNYTDWTRPETWCSGSDVMTVGRLSQVPVVVIVLVVSVQSVFVGSLSYAAGRLLNWWEDGPPREPKFVEQPWEYASKKTARESDRATVITTDGKEIRGTVFRIGSPSEDYDILLKDPEKVIRDDRTDAEVDARDLGAYTYHHYRDISRIRFPDLDTSEDFEIDVDDAAEQFEKEMSRREDRTVEDEDPD